MYREITLEQARGMPGDIPTWNNAGEAIGRGLYEGASILGEVASSVVAEALPEGGGGRTDWRQWWDENITAPATSRRQQSQERAITYGGASAALHDFARIGTEALLGGPVAVAAVETVVQGALAADQGKGATEATVLGLERGLGMGALAAVPVVAPVLRSFGPAIVQRLASGAAGSILGGVALAGADKATLAAIGYDEEAAQTAVLSGDSILANGVLGAIFGAAAHGRAALAARKVGLPLAVVDDAMAVSLRDVARSWAKTGAKTPVEAAKRLDEFNDQLDATTDGAVPDGKEGLIHPDEALPRAAAADVSPPVVDAAAKAAEEAALYPQLTLAELEAERAASEALGADLPAVLEHPEARALLEHMGGEGGWAQIGGRIKRTGEGASQEDIDAGRAHQIGEVVGRTTWVPHAPWFAGVQREAPLRGNVNGEATAEAVRKALAGEKLTMAERGHVISMVEHVKGEIQLAEQHGVTDYDPGAMAAAFDEYAKLGDQALPKDAADAAAVELALRADEAAVEAAAIKHGDDDAAFMQEIRRINGKAQGQQGAAAPQAGKAVPPAEAAFPKDLTIPDAAGNPVNANEHIAALRAEAMKDLTPELESVRQCILSKMMASAT